MLQQLAPFALVLSIWLATAILVRAWWAQREDMGIDARLRESMTRSAARRAALDAAAEARARRHRSRG